MPEFELQGRLDVGDAIVGTAGEGDERKGVIVALTENLKPKELKDLQESIRDDAEKHFTALHHRQEENGFSGLFNLLAANQMVARVKNAENAARYADLALESGSRKIIFYCDDKPSYLAVCTRLGVTRRDMIRTAELSALLPEKTTKTGKAVGRARKLCHALERGNVEISTDMAFDMRPEKSREYAKLISNAQKYSLGCLPDGKLQEPATEHRKHYLPFDPSYFEFTLSKKDAPRLGVHILCTPASDIIEGKPYDRRNMAFHIFYEMDGEFLLNGFLILIEDGKFKNRVYGNFDAVREDQMELYRKSLMEGPQMQSLLFCTHEVMNAMEIVNSPSHRPELTREELTRKQKRKKGKGAGSDLPLFSYYRVNLRETPSSDPANQNSRPAGKSPQKRSGEPAWRQRLHLRSGYERKVVTAPGETRIEIINDYLAGDPEKGIISRTREKGNDPSP